MGIRLSDKDIKDLKSQGYTETDIQEAVQEIEKEELSGSYSNVQAQRGRDPRQYSQLSSFSTKFDDNIVKWQLELNDILERAEHILRGDVPTFEEGHIIWKPNLHPENNPLNDIGVSEVLKILAMYVNRNTILSDYSNDEIHIKIYDFGREVNNLIFMRYDEFGMDTLEKKKNYPILVREIVDIVHSAYKRALDGAEKRSLREMISVSQNTSSQIGPGVTVNNQGMPQKTRGILNPLRYISGKYV